MARFRLKTAHHLFNADFKAHVLLHGDQENEHLGDERGTIVGDGTSYPITHATMEMIALDPEAEKMIEAEQARLTKAQSSMNPLDSLPLVMREMMGVGPRDDYEDRYVPGFAGVQRPVHTKPGKGA